MFTRVIISVFVFRVSSLNPEMKEGLNLYNLSNVKYRQNKTTRRKENYPVRVQKLLSHDFNQIDRRVDFLSDCFLKICF